MKTRVPLLSALAAAVLLSACASTPVLAPELARLDQELTRLRGDERVVVHAQPELDVAARAIAELHEDGRRLEEVRFDHEVYRADRLLKIAEAEGLARHAEQQTGVLAGEREQLAAELRQVELQRTQRALSSAQIEAERQRALAEQERLQAAQQRMQAEQARDAAREARNEAEVARFNADLAQQQNAALQAELAELQAKETERGMLLTLGDVLFEVDRAELKPGALLKLDELAEVLRRNDAAVIEIEGHTDSTGARNYNLQLSQMRADAVRHYLIQRGVEPERISAQGMGPDYPVASNADPAGRTQNRRVEIVIQNEQA